MSQVNIQVPNEDGAASQTAAVSSVVLVCEHASCHIPASLKGLGMSQADRESHAAWDPGALSVARHMAHRLNAILVSAKVSRLVYDCNRPPTAPDAMPARSEVIEIPGNRDLSVAQRKARIDTYYRPFRDELQRVIQQTANPVIVTVHSFTPVYHGKVRAVEIGVLHDSDARLAGAMLQTAQAHTAAVVERNQPYGPDDGVTHTLKEHAVKNGHPNVMLEIRNDLIATPEQQEAVADMLSAWLAESLARIGMSGDLQCQA